MLKLAEKKDFDNIFSILQESFPKDEYRTRDEQEALFDLSEYRVYLERSSAEASPRGFAAVWVLNDFCFLEHLAVDSRFRNQGIGEGLLRDLLARFDGRICLEVELPETETAIRRIGFYERCGFILNRYPYMQPAMSKGQNAVPLWIMTSWGALEQTDFFAIRDTLYEKVYAASAVN